VLLDSKNNYENKMNVGENLQNFENDLQILEEEERVLRKKLKENNEKQDMLFDFIEECRNSQSEEYKQKHPSLEGQEIPFSSIPKEGMKIVFQIGEEKYHEIDWMRVMTGIIESQTYKDEFESYDISSIAIVKTEGRFKNWGTDFSRYDSDLKIYRPPLSEWHEDSIYCLKILEIL
jgi:hypothetical protein